jgi:gamma-D-glutamyl-L-lysine dipeptidyl-peptidase
MVVLLSMGLRPMANATAAPAAGGVSSARPSAGWAGPGAGSVSRGRPIAVLAASGEPAWAQVSVATVWIHPTSPRPLDEPALTDPARIATWLSSMSVVGRLGLHGRIDTQMLYGRKVIILSQNGKWSDVEIPSQTGNHFPNGVIGWVPSAQLNPVAAPDAHRAVVVTTPSAWLLSAPDGVIGKRLLLLSYATELPELKEVDGYTLVGLPGGGEGAIAENAVSPMDKAPVPGGAIVAQARLFLGLPYLWGGTSGFGYDCSGLVYSVYARFGVMLPRNAADQKRATTPILLSRARPGDLLFFAGPHGTGEVVHVAIYAGEGLMVDAPYTGGVIEEIPMRSSPEWPDFAGVGRVQALSLG